MSFSNQITINPRMEQKQIGVLASLRVPLQDRTVDISDHDDLVFGNNTRVFEWEVVCVFLIKNMFL